MEESDIKGICKPIEYIFNRDQKFPVMRVSDLRKSLAILTEEYDDSTVVFTFVIKDCGDSGQNDGMKNFILGTIPVKCLVRHPDDPRVMLCDDETMDYFCNKTNAKKENV